MHTLWEADVAVFKAHITTGPGGKVLDMFWIYDNRCELPENHRSLPLLLLQLSSSLAFTRQGTHLHTAGRVSWSAGSSVISAV
jgi:hypothetical protein